MSYLDDCGFDSDDESFSDFIGEEKNYQTLYISICKKFEKAEQEKQRLIIELEEKDKKLSNLENTCKRLTEENKKLNLSIINSKTAKDGYKEEQLVCNDLNNNKELRSLAKEFFPFDFNTCHKLKGNSKVDIKSEDGEFTAQIKKFKNGQFQQVARTKRTKLYEYISDLSSFENIFEGWLDHPKGKDRRKLTKEFYTTEQLLDFVKCLNKNKEKILIWIFLGLSPESSPEYFIGSRYVKEKDMNIRKSLSIYKIKDIISTLLKKDFKIRKSGTVVELGNGVITLQRKGGDCKQSSANDLAAKIIISKLTTPCFEYNFS